ncbi:hypothetical protein KIL84_004891 [Mauremys mutica]|uniref:Uncharacterized protein n=1 Tax=Mauremys mutica TaxID=74926 RepID=A0A9D3XL02_9SAUR|nr:hypothetical protein KIL84_004891 [Mauremys mutica]
MNCPNMLPYCASALWGKSGQRSCAGSATGAMHFGIASCPEVGLAYLAWQAQVGRPSLPTEGAVLKLGHSLAPECVPTPVKWEQPSTVYELITMLWCRRDPGAGGIALQEMSASAVFVAKVLLVRWSCLGSG